MRVLKTSYDILVLTIGILALFSIILIKKEDNKDKNLLSSLNSELITWKNKDSLNVAKIQVIEMDKAKSFAELKVKDEEVIKLQGLVKQYEKQLKNQGSATILQTETEYIKEEIILVDTICGKCNFTYSDVNPWISTNINISPGLQANTLNFSLDYKVKNEYQVVVGEESNGLFKKPTPFVEVTNLNPYTETTSLRTYQVTRPKEKRWGIGPYIGGGFNLPECNFGFSAGISIHYSLMQF